MAARPGQPRGVRPPHLVNLATDGWRHRGRRPAEIGMAELPDRAWDRPDSRIDDRDVLFQALRQLTRRQRTVLVLRFWEDLSVEQTAELLGCSAGNVKSTSHRGLDRLRTLLETTGVHHA